MPGQQLEVESEWFVSAVRLISVGRRADQADLGHRLSIPLIYHSAKNIPQDSHYWLAIQLIYLLNIPDSSIHTLWVNHLHEVFWRFFPNGWEFLVEILHAYYMFLSLLDYKFLFNYLQL